jgi:hypothetical protein
MPAVTGDPTTESASGVKSGAAGADRQRVRLPGITRDPRVLHELNETHERCRVLFMEERERWAVRERIDSIGHGINPLYPDHPSANGAGDALVRLALVGWCWREAELGDPAPILDELQAAYAAALVAPAVSERLVPAWTCWKFLSDGGRPGLASPGATEKARLAFLDTAFAKMLGAYGARAGVPRDVGRAAFDHGVVLNDVERLVLGRPPLQRGT